MKGVVEGLRSLMASAIVMLVLEEKTSSCDGAVTRMAGGPEGGCADSGSGLEFVAAVTEGDRMSVKC